MFTTHQAFKHAIQLDDESTTWRAVELELQTPWFLVTTFDSGEEVERTFILAGCHEVLDFAERTPCGNLIGVMLVQPPAWSSTNSWNFVPIRRIDRVARPRGDIDRAAVVVDVDGVRHGGFPISPENVPRGHYVHVVDLPDTGQGET